MQQTSSLQIFDKLWYIHTNYATQQGYIEIMILISQTYCEVNTTRNKGKHILSFHLYEVQNRQS